MVRKSTKAKYLKTTIKWPDSEELLRAQKNADAAGMGFAPFVRSRAAGDVIHAKRGLSAKQEVQLALAIKSINEAGIPLTKIAEALQDFEWPMPPVTVQGVTVTLNAIDAFSLLLDDLRRINAELIEELL